MSWPPLWRDILASGKCVSEQMEECSLSPGTRSQPYPIDLKCSSKCVVMAAADTDPTNDFKPAAEMDKCPQLHIVSPEGPLSLVSGEGEGAAVQGATLWFPCLLVEVGCTDGQLLASVGGHCGRHQAHPKQEV